MAVNNRRGGRFHVEWLSPIPLTEIEADVQAEVPADDLPAMSYDELRDLAKTLHVSQAGKKEVLRARLADVRPDTKVRHPMVELPAIEQLASDIDTAIDTVARYATKAVLGETKLVMVNGKPHWRIRWFASLALGDRLNRMDPRFRKLRAADL